MHLCRFGFVFAQLAEKSQTSKDYKVLAPITKPTCRTVKLLLVLSVMGFVQAWVN